MWYILAGLVIAGSAIFFARWYAPLGGRSDSKRWAGSANFRRRIFVNQIATPMDVHLPEALSMLRESFRRGGTRRPPDELTGQQVDMAAFLQAAAPQVVWLGHSTVLVRVQNKTLLLDPMLSKRASPFPFAGPKRFSTPPLTADMLPPIDAVLISHDHYDHLDYRTIRKLRRKTTAFFVPLGVGAHLRRWGVQKSQIVELDWWQTAAFEGLTLACTPSRHFSGRGLNDRFKTLWCSWVVQAPGVKLFFSGDTGYGPHFKQIGEAYGPFDLTLLECGQYDTRWPNVHMQPEQTFAAFQDLRGKRLMPIHWGAFALAFHGWFDSPTRVQRAARPTKAEVMTPQMGKIAPVKGPVFPHSDWWNER